MQAALNFLTRCFLIGAGSIVNLGITRSHTMSPSVQLIGTEPDSCRYPQNGPITIEPNRKRWER